MNLSAARAFRDRLPSAGPGTRWVLGVAVALLAGGSRLSALPPPPDYSIQITLDIPGNVPLGERVPIAVRITNITERPITLSLVGRDAIAFDIVVTREDGKVVWQRLAHTAVQAILQLVTIAPGKTLELRDEWRQRGDAGAVVPTGDYTVVGEVPTEMPRRPLRTPPGRLRIRVRS